MAAHDFSVLKVAIFNALNAGKVREFTKLVNRAERECTPDQWADIESKLNALTSSGN